MHALRFFRRIITVLSFSTLVAAAAPAPGDFVRPEAIATRVAVDDAPTIDGDLSDPVWARAVAIEGLRQVDPPSGEPGTERTIVRVLYDEDNLYIAFTCYDREPEGIVIGSMTRDGALFTGDSIRIFLDPGSTGRDGYVFDVGASGGRADGLIQNNAQQIYQWDAIWQVRTRIVSDGWAAEVAIPFRSLSYGASTEWGFNFSRIIRRKNEALRWSWRVANTPAFDLSQAGRLTGISGIREGLGIDVRLYGRANFQENWKGDDRGVLSGTAGGNAYYRITPALTGTITGNPDFSDTPLDPRQINLSRFSLFTPETRDFFLQDTGSFEFGGRGLGGQNARPFFSRNIGLVNGAPVTVMGGGKVSGQYEDVGIGLLSARTSAIGAIDGQLLSAARLTKPVLGESRVGVIFTNGDPSGLTDNTLAGGDFQYRNTSLFGSKTFQSDIYYERSFSDTHGADDSFGFALNYPNEPWGGFVGAREIGMEFHPALGFLNRPGIRNYEVGLNHLTRYQDGLLRTFGFGGNTFVTTGLDNRTQSRTSLAFANIFTDDADSAGVQVLNVFEAVPAAFSLPGDLPVPQGDYNWTNFTSFIGTNPARMIGANFNAECCSFYNGTYFRAGFGISLRLFESIEISPRYNATFITMPGGDVQIHVPSLDTAINFTPDMQFLMQAQFDNISRQFGFSARYRWEYSPGDEIFASIGQSALIPGTNFQPQQTQLALRVGQTLRF